MSLLNANCDALFSQQNHHNQKYGNMSTQITLDQTRGVLETILYQLSPTTTSRINSKEGADRMTLSAAPPLQLFENAIIQCPCLSLHADLDSSMVSTQHHSHSHHSNDRTQAKDHAIKLLSRPMTYVHGHSPLSGNTNPMTTSSPSAIIAVIGRTVQQHVFASFAVLVDRRLHAYTDVLTRHAIVLSSMYQHIHHHQHDEVEKANPVPPVLDGRSGTATSTSLTSVRNDNNPIDVEEEEDVVNSKMLVLNEKKWMIQNKGIQTEAQALTSHFQLLPSPPFTTMILVPEETTTTSVLVSPTPIVVINAPIRYTMTMELHIPVEHDYHHGTKKIVPVSFSTDGFIKCAYSSQGDGFVFKSIKINLNTKDLLDKMVQETTRAVSVIVEVVNSLCQHNNNDKKRSLLPRSVSYLAMPPPPPVVNRLPQQHHQEEGKITSHTHYRRSILDGTSNDTITDTTGLDLLCNAVVTDSVPVVSPQLSNTPSPNHHITFDLSFNNDDAEHTHQKIDEDVSRLSLDQCADIVDVCLFGESFDTNHYDLDYVATPRPPSKRIKIEQ